MGRRGGGRCVADPRALAVAELVLAERRAGRVVREFAIGWAGLPLLQRNAVGRLAPMAPGEHRDVDVYSGSARYLLWGRPRAGFPPPRPLTTGTTGGGVVAKLR